jgi:hypothetical protein
MKKRPTQADIANIFNRHSSRAGVISNAWGMIGQQPSDRPGLQSRSDVYSRPLALSFVDRRLAFELPRRRQVDQHREGTILSHPDRMQSGLLEQTDNISRRALAWHAPRIFQV